MRKYTIDRAPRRLLIFEHRQILDRDWHDRIVRRSMPTLRGFVTDHGLPLENWRRQ